MDREDILDNKFFQTLQRDHAALYAQVQKNLWVVLVPQTPSLSGLKLTKEIIQMHILKPSPLFKQMYEVTSSPEKTVEFDDSTITTQTGFPTPSRTVNILFEETFYNKDYLPYPVFCIDQPLVGGSKKPVEHFVSPVTMPSPKQFAESMDYLRAFPENELVLKKIDRALDEFQSTYVLIKGYEQDARDKVAGLVENAFEQLLCTNMFFRKMQNNSRQLHDVSMIIESYVMLGLFHTLCSGLRESMDAEDSLVTEINSGHRSIGTQLSDFGIRLALKPSDFTKAIAVLDELEYCKTPIQMLYTLQSCVDSVSSTLSVYFTTHKGTDPITTDDLIPIFAFIITQSPFRYFQSTITYIEYFTFEDNSNSELGYNFTNFKAALTFLADPEMFSMKILSKKNIKIRDSRRISKNILTPRAGSGAPPILMHAHSPDTSPSSSSASTAPPHSPVPLLKAASQTVLENQSSIDSLLRSQEATAPALLQLPTRSGSTTVTKMPRAAISLDPTGF